MKNDIVRNAIINAVLTSIYIIGIGSFLFYAPQVFVADKTDTVLVPIVMLSLFVFSAALTGLLILGRPILWYLDGKKREATYLLVYTLGVFLIITIAALSLLLVLGK